MAETQLKRYPIRGALFGLMLGFSAAYFMYFQFAVFGFDTLGGVATRFGIIVLLGAVVGVVWAYVAPAKKPKEPAPPAVVAEAAPPEAPEAEESEAEETPETDDASGDDEPSETNDES